MKNFVHNIYLLLSYGSNVKADTAELAVNRVRGSKLTDCWLADTTTSTTLTFCLGLVCAACWFVSQERELLYK